MNSFFFRRPLFSSLKSSGGDGISVRVFEGLEGTLVIDVISVGLDTNDFNVELATSFDVELVNPFDDKLVIPFDVVLLLIKLFNSLLEDMTDPACDCAVIELTDSFMTDRMLLCNLWGLLLIGEGLTLKLIEDAEIILLIEETLEVEIEDITCDKVLTGWLSLERDETTRLTVLLTG